MSVIFIVNMEQVKGLGVQTQLTSISSKSLKKELNVQLYIDDLNTRIAVIV